MYNLIQEEVEYLRSLRGKKKSDIVVILKLSELSVSFILVRQVYRNQMEKSLNEIIIS